LNKFADHYLAQTIAPHPRIGISAIRVGSPYRTVIFTHVDEQNALALASRGAREDQAVQQAPSLTEIVASGPF